MEVIIYGAIGGGAKLVFPTQNVHTAIVSALVKDLRRGNNEFPLGQTAYSLEFSSNGCAFTKCVIVRDIQRKAMGYVAFSVFNPNNEKLSGIDAKALLDQLANDYCSKNIIDNNFDIGKNDCGFVNELTREYEGRLRHVSGDDTENIQQGTAEAAFVYYSTDEKLQKYFDAPYQEEYNRFKQVFFVKSDLEGKPENPINALRHNPSSNLTGQVDLENPKYKILYNENAKGGVKIEVRTNGSKRNNRNKIRRKNELEIIYTKPYYQGIKKMGKWYELPDFVIVDDNTQTVTIREVELSEFSPETITITFEVKDRKSNPIYDAEITVDNNSYQNKPTVTNNKATFVAEGMKDKWTVLGKKGNFSGKKIFTPENQSANVVLILEEHKVITFQVRDEEGQGPIHNYRIQIHNKSIEPGDTSIEFIGDEIYKPWNITISHDEYEKKTFSYSPENDENFKYVNLRKKQSSSGGRQTQKYYKVSAGKYGTLKNGNEYTSNDHNGSDVKDKIVPNKGYKFIRFELNNDTLTAVYGKKKPFYTKPRFIAAFVTGIISLVIVLCFILFSGKDGGSIIPQDMAQEIIDYCNGNELNEQKLKGYQTKYCKNFEQAPEEQSFWQQIFPFGSKKKGKSTVTPSPDYCQIIDSAIAIRSAIKFGRIDVLKIQQYSVIQKSFSDALLNIDDNYKQKIGETMNKEKVSTMDLNQVADFIGNLQKLLMIDINTLDSESDCDKKIREIDSLKLTDIEIVKSVKDQINSKKDILKTTAGAPSGSNGASPPITKDDLLISDSHAAGRSNLKTEFWRLVQSGNDAKDSYDKLLKNSKENKNTIQEDKDILDYLKKICKNSDSFRKFKNIPVIDRKSANKLTQIDID